jgi:DNA-binding Lrp family transcriptional regulator
MADMPSHEVDEVDVVLLDAMHANPRASFERLASVLGLSAVTVARRWQRLSGTGRAWVSSVPGPRLALVGAVFQVEAKPGETERVGRQLVRIPQVGSVYLTDGAFDVHALVFTDDMSTLSTLIFDHLPRVHGAARVRTNVGVEWFSGTQWRLHAISSGQERSVVEGEAPERNGDRTKTFSATDRALFLALQRDGRATYRDLADELGTSDNQVRRRMTALNRAGLLGFRTDFARGEGGWRTELVLWLRVPAGQLRAAGTELSAWPETRICLSLVGEANLLLMVQVHRVRELAAILERVAHAFPQVVALDQRVVLRPMKSWGRLLDDSGHSVGVVPVDPWALSAASASESIVETAAE